MPHETVIDGRLMIRQNLTDEDGSPVGISLKPFYPDDVVPDGARLYQEPSVHLVWRRDEWAQIQIEWDRDDAVDLANYILQEAAEGRTGRYSVYLDIRDRNVSNRFIRLLRRLRDQVFGADA